MKTIHTKVCILGAGPAGAATALFLANKGIPSVLLEKETFPRDKICGDALSGKVISTLKKLDPLLVDEFLQQPIQLGSWGVKFIAPNLKELKVPFKKNFDKSGRAPGFIAKRIDFDNFLAEQVRKRKEIDFIENCEADKIERIENGFSITSKDKSLTVTTNLLIASNGAQSAFSRNFGNIKIEHKHYCAGLRAYYKGVEGMDADNFIELHFIKEALPGYFWIFPLPNGMANVGLGMRSDKVSAKKVNLKKLLAEIVNYPQFRDRFKNATLEGEVKGFGLPLGSKKRKLSGDNYILTGDAASLIDPFTGEGISNAMISGMYAAEQAAKAVSSESYAADFLNEYDTMVYKRLGKELNVSTRMNQLVNYPWLFNIVVNKAASNKELSEMISCMFDDIDLRKKLKQPSFYLRLLWGK